MEKEKDFLNQIVALALKTALNAAKKDEIPVAAVIFNSETGTVLSVAANQTKEKNDRTAHAEILAIRKACHKLKCGNLSGYSLFSTLEPCTMCAGACALVHLDAVYFGACDLKTGGILQGAKVFTWPQTHHKPRVEYGFSATECGEILTEFFKRKRKK